MTDPVHELAAAELRAAMARDRLSGTVAELQERLDPKLLAREAKDAGTAAALAGVDQAKRNPAIVTGAIGVTVLLIARRRIARLFRRKPKRVPAAPIDHSAPPRGSSHD